MLHPFGPRSSRPLRVMTWNVRSLRDDRGAVLQVIRAFAPDLLLLQEAPRLLRARSKLAALARETGLVVAAGSGKPVAILTSLRLDVAAERSVELSKTRGLHQRWVAIVRLSFPEIELVAAAVHLGLDGDERVRHVAEIQDAIKTFGASDVLVGGDLNEQSDGRAWGTMQGRLADAGAQTGLPTYPAVEPRQRIDTIFAPASWSVRSVSPAEVGCDADIVRASDHRPLVIDVMG